VLGIRARKINALLVIAATLLLTSCWGGSGSSTSGGLREAQRNSSQLLTNQEWQEAVSAPDKYIGAKVELKGRIFHVLGVQDGAFRFQMFTNPEARQGNTHVEWGGSSEGLKEGVDVLVTGTFKEIRVTTSAAGTELRIPSVTASSVEILSENPESGSPQPSPSPEPSPTPTATIRPPAVTASPRLPQTPLPPASPTLVIPPIPSAFPSPVITPTPGASPTPAMSPTPTVGATATPSPPARIPTPSPATATPTPAPSPLAVEQGKPAQVDLSTAVIKAPMVARRDAELSENVYLETTQSDQTWNGVGRAPTTTGSASVTIDVAHEGEYAIWARMYYQNVDANSFWIRIDDQPAIKMGNEDDGYGEWRWVGWRDGNTGDRATVSLSEGSHTLEIIGREKGTRIDSVIITDDLDYLPGSPQTNWSLPTRGGRLGWGRKVEA